MNARRIALAWLACAFGVTIAAESPVASPAASAGTRAPTGLEARVSSFGASDDVWRFASEALRSADAAWAYEGYMGARECLGVVHLQDALLNFSSGGASFIARPLTAERQLAVARLMSRCGGFARAGVASSRQRVAELKAHALATGAALATRSLRIDSPAAMEEAVPGIVDQWARSQGFGNTGDRRTELASLAGMLFTCEWGKACSAGSYAADLRCVMTQHCGRALWSDWQQGLSAEEIATVLYDMAQIRRLVLE